MISHRLILVPSLAFALAACGGPPPANSPEGGPPGHHGGPHGDGHGEHHGDGHGPAKGPGGEHHDHAKLSPPLKDFHEVLKPLWHAEKGPARTDKTCAEAKTLHEKAEATKDAELIEATKALSAECEKEGRPEFEARLVTVHERFHALTK